MDEYDEMIMWDNKQKKDKFLATKEGQALKKVHYSQITNYIMTGLEFPPLHKKIMLLAIKDGGGCSIYFTTYIARLASLCEVSERAIFQALKDLAFYNLIDKKSLSSGKKGVIIKIRHDMRNWNSSVCKTELQEFLLPVEEVAKLGVFDDPYSLELTKIEESLILDKPDM